MDSYMLATPSRKTTEHNGMADRKAIKYRPLEDIDHCRRRLF